MDRGTADLCRLTQINADALQYSLRREVILFIEFDVKKSGFCVGVISNARCDRLELLHKSWMDRETADLCRLTQINADALLYTLRREVILFIEAV
jgi:hypothetical protein